MSSNYCVSDLVAIIRNGYLANKRVVSSQYSKLRGRILEILKDEGYITGYSKSDERVGVSRFDIYLKYYQSKPVVNEIRVISTPGKRVYCHASKIPLVKNGLGSVLISTSRGVVSDHVARQSKLGGELLLRVF